MSWFINLGFEFINKDRYNFKLNFRPATFTETNTTFKPIKYFETWKKYYYCFYFFKCSEQWKDYFRQVYHIASKENTNRIPGFRNQLFWETCIQLSSEEKELIFFTSDVTGVFEIIIEGFTNNLEPISIKKFIVES